MWSRIVWVLFPAPALNIGTFLPASERFKMVLLPDTDSKKRHGDYVKSNNLVGHPYYFVTRAYF